MFSSFFVCLFSIFWKRCGIRITRKGGKIIIHFCRIALPNTTEVVIKKSQQSHLYFHLTGTSWQKSLTFPYISLFSARSKAVSTFFISRTVLPSLSIYWHDFFAKYNRYVGNKTNESAMFRNFTFYFIKSTWSPSLSHCSLSHALVSLILNIYYDPIVKSSVTYRKKSTGNQSTLNNLSQWQRGFSHELVVIFSFLFQSANK